MATQTLPQAIAAATQVSQPDGYTLITIGFKKSLNYPFVVSHPVSSAQLFSYLPNVLNYPFNYTFSDVQVYQLVPLKSSSRDYLITVAKVYFPSEQVEVLQKLISNTATNLYSNSNPTEKSLASLIDPTIPLTGIIGDTDSTNSSSDDGTSTDSDSSEDSKGSHGSSSGSSSSDSDSDNEDTGGLDFSSKSNSSSGKYLDGRNKGKIAGLVIGVFLGACVYLAIIMLAVRYYILRRRQSSAPHLSDNSSIETGSSGTYPGARLYDLEKSSSFNDRASISPSMKIDNWMNYNHYADYPHSQDSHAGSGYAGKKQSMPKISRPIATENSLGWNDM